MLAIAAVDGMEGDWLIADHQTAGKGRMGRRWSSEPGNCYASCLIRLRPGDPDAATLAFVAAIALFDAVSGWSSAIQLKWPNDLLSTEGAKLSGILLERAADAVVIGFGVNLAHAPQNIGRPVASLSELAGEPPDPVQFLETLAPALVEWTDRWRNTGLATIREAWLSRAHGPGKALAVSMPDGEMLRGVFDGLTPACALRLCLADGSVRVIHAGDVFLS